MRVGLPSSVAPSGSLGVVNSTGSCIQGTAASVVDQAMLWDDPQATLLIRTPSKPATRVGFLSTVTVPEITQLRCAQQILSATLVTKSSVG